MPYCLYCQDYYEHIRADSGWIVIHSPAGNVYVCPDCGRERGLLFTPMPRPKKIKPKSWDELEEETGTYPEDHPDLPRMPSP